MSFNILFPIEIIFREMDYKLILAAMCVSKSSTVYIGQHDYLYDVSKYMTGGLYVGKNSMRRANIFNEENIFNPRSDGLWLSERHIDLKERGISVVHLDEEGAIWYGKEEELTFWLTKRRCDITALDENDTMCTYGDFQNSIYKKYTKVKSKNIITTGHPRFDILREKYRQYYADDVAKIKSEFGDFILINSSFSLYNNQLGDSFTPRLGYDLTTDETRSKHVNRWGYVGKIFIEMIKLITTISIEHPDKKIVFRPHPTEDISIYNAIFANIENVSVVKERSVAPWLLSCELMIHHACTTGVEAYFAEANIINYDPFNEPENTYHLPNILGVLCTTQGEVLDYIKSLYKGEKIPEGREPKDDFSLSAIKNFHRGHQDNDSFNRIVSIIRKFESNTNNATFNHLLFNLFRVKFSLIYFLKRLVRPFFPKKQADYLAFKDSFPGFDKKYILSKIEGLEALTKKRINIKIINKNLIKITEEHSA